MALGTPATSTIAEYSTAGGTTVAPEYPDAVPTANDVLILFVGQKPSTANGGTVTTPAGWTLIGELKGAGGYGTTLGADTGNTNIYVYRKNTVTSADTWPATLTITVGANNVCWARICHVPGGTGAKSFSLATGADTAAGSVSVTGSANPGFTAGDVALWGMCIPTDVTTPSQFSAHAITAAGAAFAAAVELSEQDSTAGNDIGGYLAYAAVSSGTSTAAPVVTATAGGTTTNVRGPMGILRIREAAVAAVRRSQAIFIG